MLYADDESFTFMTPEGHTLSAWITFSARQDGDVVVAEAQALERPADPFDDLAYLLGGNRQNNKFWEATLRNLATTVGVTSPNVVTQVVLHRPPAPMALLAQRPQQRDAAIGSPDHHGARSEAERPGVRPGAP